MAEEPHNIVTLFATSGPKGTTAVQAKTHLAKKTGSILKSEPVPIIKILSPDVHRHVYQNCCGDSKASSLQLLPVTSYSQVPHPAPTFLQLFVPSALLASSVAHTASATITKFFEFCLLFEGLNFATVVFIQQNCLNFSLLTRNIRASKPTLTLFVPAC
ncbi:hypothetical protein ACTXT7_016173 [Hymenolepis weldensis]